MNTKLLSILFVLLLGIGFSSCSKDKDENKNEAGKTAGANLRDSVKKIYESGVSLESSAALYSLYNSYQAYKSNSSDDDWKKGFLEGSALSESQADQLDTLLGSSFNAEFIINNLPQIFSLFNLGK